MSVEQDKLRAALQMLHKSELEDVAYDMGVELSANRKDDVVDELTREDWEDEAFSELIDLVEHLEKEDRPRGHYISEIESVSSVGDQTPKESILSKLRNREVEFTDDGTDIEEAGFEADDGADDSIQGTYWTKTEDYILNPLGDLRPTSTLYGTGFTIDLEEERVYIQASIYGKAQGLRSLFEEMGITLEPVGFQNLTNEASNRKMEEFVEDFEARLDELDDQTQLGDH